MKFKGTLWLTAGLIGLVLYYFFVDLPQEQKEKEDRERSEKVLLFEPADVEEFSISQNGQTITLKRQGNDEWGLLAPVEAKADDEASSSYLNRLQTMRFTRVVEESPADLSTYGLDKPSLTVSLKLKGKKETGLSVGDDNPMGHSLYIQRSDDEKVLLTRAPRNDLGKSVYDLRDKKVMEFNADEVVRLEIKRKGPPLTFVKTGDSWNVSEETTARGDADAIRNFVDSLLFLQVKKFVDEKPESLSAFGLDTPPIQLTLERGEKGPPISLSVGNKNVDGYYAKSGGAENVILLSKRFVDKLSSKMTAFMDKTLAPFKEDEVTGLQFRSGEEDIRLTRGPQDKNKWGIVQPIKTPASTATMNSLLFDLKAVRIEEFIETSLKDPELFGLRQPKRELTVLGESGKLWTLKLGNQTSDGKHFFADRSGDSSVFTLGEDDVKKVFRTLHDLRDRKILHFKREEAARVLIQYPKKTIELKREDNEWSLVQPEAIKKIKPLHGNDILWTLNALEFESQVDPVLNEKESGMNEPAVRITLWDKNGQKLPSLSVGNPVENSAEHYARVAGNPALYRIKSRFLDEIPSNINKFKD